MPFPAILFIIFCALFCGCEGCGSEDENLIARLVGISGVVERDFATKINQWESATVGARFVMGDGIRAKEGSGARLRMRGGSQLQLKENTQIRFREFSETDQAHGIDVESGEAEILVGDETLRLNTSVGVAIIEKNSRIRIRKSDEDINFQVEIGTVLFKREDGEETVLGAGSEIRIGIGSAMVVGDGEAKQELKEEDTETESESESESESEEPAGGDEKDNLVSVEAFGRGIKLRRPNGKRWRPLARGKGELQPSTQVQVAMGSRLNVMRGKERATLRGPGVYRIGEAGESLIQMLKGRVILQATDVEVSLGVPGGRIVALAGEPGGTRASVRARKGKSNVAVKKGRVTVFQADGETTLEAGEKISFSKQSATDQNETEEASDITEEEGPAKADLVVRAGDSFIVHSSSPPVAIQFRTGTKCPGESILRIGRRQTRGEGAGGAKILVAKGRHRYSVRCVSESGTVKKNPLAEGVIFVSRDSGTALLPSKAPSSRVEADGRKYKVWYQNLLPKITFLWRKAPAWSSYAVVVKKPNGNIKRFTTRSPEYSFSSGKLGDGKHRLTFEQVGGKGRKSKTTVLDIRFDNVAPKAIIRAPGEHSFDAGQNVAVSGVAVPGWNVSIPGANLEIDDQNRFKGNVLFGGNNRGIAIRLNHPKRRVHYYIRRARGE